MSMRKNNFGEESQKSLEEFVQQELSNNANVSVLMPLKMEFTFRQLSSLKIIF